MTRSPYPLLSLLALLTVALLAGCGEKKDTLGPREARPVSLLLDYFPNADHAGIYAAQAGGHFRDAGLKVAIRQPADPAAPIKQVAAGRVDLAVSYEPEVLRARDQGLPVVAVAALVQEPLTSIIWLPDADIEDPSDLAGKTVGTAGIDYQSAFLKAILDEAGVDPGSVTETNLGFNLVPGIVSGKADAVLGAFWNYEGTDLRRQGRNPRIVPVQDAGVPAYDELVLVANEDELAKHPEPIRRFIAALARGERSLNRDSGPALDALLETNADLDRGLQQAVVNVTLPLFAAPAGKPYGWLEPAAWREFGRFMFDAGLLDQQPDGKAFTNELLPAAPETG